MGFGKKTSAPAPTPVPTPAGWRPPACPWYVLIGSLLLACQAGAADRWTSSPHDAAQAAMVHSGAALPYGPDPAQWASLDHSHIQLSSVLGPGRSPAAGLDLSLNGPLDPRHSFGAELSLLNGDDSRADGGKKLAFRDARLRLGAARTLMAAAARSGPAVGGALILYDRNEASSPGRGAAVDFGLRSPLPGAGFSAALAVRELAVLGSDPEASAGEGVLAGAFERGPLSLGLDMSLPFPLATGKVATLRAGAAFAPVPWFSFACGYTTPEASGQGPLLGIGGQWLRGQMELGLSALHRGGPQRTSLHASLGWHFETPHALPKRAVWAPRPTPAATPEPDPGTFDLQAAYRDGQVHVAWPLAGPSPGGYNLYMGLVPGASMKLLNDEPLRVKAWKGSPGMRGMTYYFRLRSLQQDGALLEQSRLQSVQVPAQEGP